MESRIRRDMVCMRVKSGEPLDSWDKTTQEESFSFSFSFFRISPKTVLHEI